MNALVTEYTSFLQDIAQMPADFSCDYYRAGTETTTYGRYLRAVQSLQAAMHNLSQMPEKPEKLTREASRYFLQARRLRAQLPKELDRETRRRLDREREEQSIRRKVAVDLLFRKVRGIIPRSTCDQLFMAPRALREEIVETLIGKDPEALLRPFLEADAPGEEFEGMDPDDDLAALILDSPKVLPASEGADAG